MEEAKELSYLALLEMAGVACTLSNKTLALKEKSGEALNLEYLLARCVSQARDKSALLAQSRPFIGPAACTPGNEAASHHPLGYHVAIVKRPL